MNNNKIFLVLVYLLAVVTFQQNVCMDTQHQDPELVKMLSLPGLPRELKGHILALCNRDMDQEERIAELIKLRRVCATWCTILTDKFIADTVGLPTVSWELEEALKSAALNGQTRTVSLICTAYPWVSKQKALNEIGKYLDTIEMHFDVLEVLLNFGLSPSAKIVRYHSDALGGFIAPQDDDFYTQSILHSMVCHDFSITPQARKIFDLLLDLEADTTELGLLEMAARQRNLYAIDTLLTFPLHPLTDFGQVCRDLSGGWCCTSHHQRAQGNQYQLFTTIVDELVRRGGDRALFYNLPERCESAIIANLNENNEKFDAFVAQYNNRTLPAKEFDAVLTDGWKIIDEGDVIRTEFSQRTGQHLDLWRPQYMAQDLPQPGTRNVRAKFESRLYWGVAALALCYLVYDLWYLYTLSADDEQSEDSEQEVADNDDAQPQESDL